MNYKSIVNKLKDSPVLILILIVLGVDADSVERLMQLDPATYQELSEWIKSSVSNDTWLKVTAFFGWLTYLYKKEGDVSGGVDKRTSQEADKIERMEPEEKGIS